ncbi:glutathione S-transferase family protein [Roseitranquillus sediminis]|uniref:glutathione S-transferase family protein n=1 Tax=Roseitranquillus sediminis TaxID=2809051 RepID=UPI001D0CAD02|nr:glutathione S-transferase family protein [Roseitranquillus sediminis]MBM9594166.1 glutathione S-transferase family protein [Roseitranquillus sediminis]
MADLTFWTNPMSRGRIVRWMLEETGAEYETHVLGYGPEMKSPDYLAVNPMGKVPAIRHRGTVVTECAAICAYLADAFHEAGLAPDPASPARGTYYRWLFFGAGPVEAAVTNASLGVKLETPQLEGRVGYGSMQRVLDTLQDWLDGREYVLGDRFSAADVYLGAQVAWGLQFGTLEERPGFRDYAERLMARSAAIRAREADDALIPQGNG